MLNHSFTELFGLTQILNLQQSSSEANIFSEDQYSTMSNVNYQRRPQNRSAQSALKQEEFQCTKCDKSYRYKKNMIRHIRFECGKDPQFQCPYCPHQTKQKSSMQTHIRNRHSNPLK